MVDTKAVDFFFVRDVAKVPPARNWQPGREVGNRRDNFHGITGAAGEVLRPLMDENSLERIGLVGIKSCKRQDSQALSIGFKFSRRRTPDSIECVSPKSANGRITKPFCFTLARLAYSDRPLMLVSTRVFPRTLHSIAYLACRKEVVFLYSSRPREKRCHFARSQSTYNLKISFVYMYL